MSQRKLTYWLLSYREYTSNSEPPDAFNLWCGISTISSALQRKVLVDQGHFKLYPNMYIILVAPPGRCRKGVAIGISSNFLSKITNVKLSADAITKEKLIEELEAARDNFNIGSKIEIHSSMTVVSKELSVFLGKQNVELLALLTELFDSHDKWEYKTKHSGSNTIHGQWLSILGATTPEWLTGSIPLTAIGGGFTSRVVFVVANKKARSIARPVLSKTQKELGKELVHDLTIINQLYGTYAWSQEGGELFDTWYEDIDKNPLMDDTRFQGYVERKSAHVAKVAMILAAAESDVLILEHKHIDMAIKLMEDVEPEMVNAFGAVGRSSLAQDVERVFDQIMRNKVLSYSALISLNWRDLKMRDLDDVLGQLERWTIIERLRNKTTDEISYQWSGKQLSDVMT